ncbi:MAG: hypothetical protein ACREMP_06480 [Candidatus Tyrphobacter sp.]
MKRGWPIEAVAALALLGLTCGALAQAQPVANHYYTELYRYPDGGFPVSATMDLTVSADGSIRGYYHPTDGGVRPVFGSVSGSKIQLSIGGVQGVQVNGTLGADGKIEGRAFRAFGRALYSFIGRPIPNDNALPRVH